jgi:hypothetical protein
MLLVSIGLCVAYPTTVLSLENAKLNAQLEAARAKHIRVVASAEETARIISEGAKELASRVDELDDGAKGGGVNVAIPGHDGNRLHPCGVRLGCSLRQNKQCSKRCEQVLSNDYPSGIECYCGCLRQLCASKREQAPTPL